MRSAPRPRTAPRAVLGALLLAALAVRPAAAHEPGRVPDAPEPARPTAPVLVALTLRCLDTQLLPMPVRARVQASDGRSYPRPPDLARLANDGKGGYFYLDGETTLLIPPGTTRVTMGRGFEWRPYDATVPVDRDTTVEVRLEPLDDVHALGWYAGDVHVHMDHPPYQYTITPEVAKRVAVSEGLAVTHYLDAPVRFTGEPDVLSDSSTILYWSYEHRNQTYGHVSLPGLAQRVENECCLAPQAPFPTNVDLARGVLGSGALFALAHPHTTEDDQQFCCWPGVGLGRDLPVLAGLGLLEAMEVASYSNEPDLDTADWYDLLSLGIGPRPVAGTDGVLNWNNQPPAGGWRVYAQLEPGQPFTYPNWVEAVRAGRTFVTSYPLIPEFTVNGVGPGGSLEVEDDTVRVRVAFDVRCGVSVRRVALIADGVEVWSRPFTQWPPIEQKDSTLTLVLPTPAWMALRVEGPVGHPHSAIQPPVAHSNAVRFTRWGAPRRIPSKAQRWIDMLDRLVVVMNARGGWESIAQQDSVLARIAQARAAFVSLAQPVVGAPGRTRVLPAPRAWPNPAFGAVRFEGFGVDVDVFDASGRRVARVPAGDQPSWDGRDGARRARPGLYFARSIDGRSRARFVVVR